MFSTSLNQTITYWGPSSIDTYGATVFAAPVTRRGRWEDRAQIIQNKTGGEYVSKTRVFMDEDFELDGYLYLGTSVQADPRNQQGAFEIQQKASTPDLAGLKTLYTAYL